MSSTLTGTIATYLAQVRTELADLPPGELDDVLDDVASHLTEVAAEFGTPPTDEQLRGRLGRPRQYADQLRTAAGYPAPVRSADDGKAAGRALRWGVTGAVAGPFLVLIGLFTGEIEAFGLLTLFGLGLVVLAAVLGLRALGDRDPEAVLETPRGAQGAALARELIGQIPPQLRRELVTVGQPVWWIVRGVLGGGCFFALFGTGAVAVVGALAGAVVSVWIGRRTQQNRRWLWYVVPLNVIAALAVPVFLLAAFLGANNLFSLSRPNEYRGSSSSQQGLRLDGTMVTNLYPYDESGRPVSVRLYTENGEPVNLPLDNSCAIAWPSATAAPVPSEQLSNLFPLPTAEPDPSTGTVDPENCRDTVTAPFAPPPPPAIPSRPTPTPGPGQTTPTPSPAGRPAPSPAPTSRSTPTPAPSPAPGSPGVTLTVSPTR